MVGYLGPERTLAAVVSEPPWSLVRQSWEPRLQRHGVVNADGFGVGWFAPEMRLEPACYRSDRPIWADRSFASLAGVVTSPVVLAAVRSATSPSPSDISGAHPFTADRWLFAHNGKVFGFHDGVGTRLRRAVSGRREPGIVGAADSEVLFALVLDRLDAGAGPGDALCDVVATVEAEQGGRLTLLLTDGQRLAATRWGEDLHTVTRDAPSGREVQVASEPSDDGSDWQEVPDHSLVTVDLVDRHLTVHPICLGGTTP
ncbi:ergothioneine biosynthesis protein EgtC [soil metagenome]